VRSRTCSTPCDLRYALAEADASFKSTMQACGTDWVALSNGRGGVAGSPTVREAERLELSYHHRFGVIVPSTVTTRLLRRVGPRSQAAGRRGGEYKGRPLFETEGQGFRSCPQATSLFSQTKTQRLIGTTCGATPLVRFWGRLCLGSSRGHGGGLWGRNMKLITRMSMRMRNGMGT
jgi:hypothetical protein